MKKSGLLTEKHANLKFSFQSLSYLQIIIFLTGLGSIIVSCAINPGSNSETIISTPQISPGINDILPTKTKTISPIEPITEIQKTQEIHSVNPTSAISESEINSPLKEITLEELPDILSNPFQRPSPGRDDGHPGVDFSFYSYRSWKTINDLEIQSVLSGKISGITNNRPPYGNAIIIETNINSLENAQEEFFQSMYPETPFQDNIILNCPLELNQNYNFSNSDLSLYILYGHLSSVKPLITGDQVVSGQIIGQVGNTGFSGNPHLHIELRIGPKSATFQDMAHYDNSVTAEEIENYCLWRVSGYFYPIDPFMLLSKNHTKP